MRRVLAHQLPRQGQYFFKGRRRFGCTELSRDQTLNFVPVIIIQDDKAVEGLLVVVRDVAVARLVLPTDHGGVFGQVCQTLVDGGKVARRLQNGLSIVGMEQAGDGHVEGSEGMGGQKGVKEALDGVRVANLVREPGNDPSECKKGFHVAVVEMSVECGIEFSQERKENES